MRLLILALIVAAPVARAADLVVSHQGYLLGVNDLPLDSPSQPITFSLWTDATTGTSMWSGTCSLPVRAGYFAAQLGDGTCGSAITDATFSAGARWLQLTVGSTPLLPRLRVGEVPIAANASLLEGQPLSALVRRSETTLPLTPTGTASATTFLRGDGAWAVPAGALLGGRSVSASAPGNGEVLAWNQGAGSWGPVVAASATASGAATDLACAGCVDASELTAAAKASSTITHDDTTSQLGATTVKTAIDLLAGASGTTRKVRSFASAPTTPAPAAGDVYYDTGVNRIFLHDGSTWRRLLLQGEGGAGVGPTFSDSFLGSALGAQWTQGLGSVTASVANGRYTVADASETDTYGWFYDVDCTKGNQLRWAHAIGTGDFDITGQLGWTTTLAADVFGGYFGLVRADGSVSAIAGWADGSGNLGGGNMVAMMRNGSCPGGSASNDSAVAYTPTLDIGQGTVRLRRVSGVVTISFNGTEVITATNTDSIAYVALITNRHFNGSTHYAFGTIDFLDLQGTY